MQKEGKALTEFHKDVLRGIEGDLLKVFADQNLDRVFVPVFRDVLAHEVGLWETDNHFFKKQTVVWREYLKHIPTGKDHTDTLWH